MVKYQGQHHWEPQVKVLDHLRGIFGGQRVLDVGPGNFPLPWATLCFTRGGAAAIGKGDPKHFNSDFEVDGLPYADKEFDLVYCRHVIEDLHFPAPLIKELFRIGRHVYIETPSPIAELCRGVDGPDRPDWRGYRHHHWYCWSEKTDVPAGGDLLHLLPKYNFFEQVKDSGFDEAMCRLLLKGPMMWNTHFLSSLPAFVVYRHERDFELTGGFDRYCELLHQGCMVAEESASRWDEVG